MHAITRYFCLSGLILILALSALTTAQVINTAHSQTAGAPVATGPSGLPLPRFVSLKSNRVNVRRGPSQDHPISWIFLKEGLPVEIIAEFENWRQVRDSDGAEGWIFHSLLSARRTVLVAPWSDEEYLALRSGPDDRSPMVAKLGPGVLADLNVCAGNWCEIELRGVTGYIAQELLFGAYRNETIE